MQRTCRPRQFTATLVRRTVAASSRGACIGVSIRSRVRLISDTMTSFRGGGEMRMMRSAAAGVLGVLALCSIPGVDHAQTVAPLAGAVLGHVGLAVRDIDASARMYSQIFGAPVSKP